MKRGRTRDARLSDKTKQERSRGRTQEVTEVHIPAERGGRQHSSYGIRLNGQLEAPVRAQRALSIYKTPQTVSVCVYHSCVCVCVCVCVCFCIVVCVCVCV